MSAFMNVAAIALAGAGLAAAQAPEAAAAAGECVSLVDAVGTNGLGRLGEAVLSVTGETGAAALAALATSTVELSDEDKVTIFAPEDAAWPPAEDLPTGGALLDVLLGHVVPDYLPAEDVLEALSAGDEVPLETLAGDSVTATMEGASILVAAPGQMIGSEVIETDIMTCAGVIHVIDALLLPDAAGAPGMDPLGGPGGPLGGPLGGPGGLAPAEGPMPLLDDALAPMIDPVTGAPLPGPLDAEPPIGVDGGFEDEDTAALGPAGADDEATRGLDSGVVGSDTDAATSKLEFAKKAVFGTVLAVVYTLGSMGL